MKRGGGGGGGGPHLLLETTLKGIVVALVVEHLLFTKVEDIGDNAVEEITIVRDELRDRKVDEGPRNKRAKGMYVMEEGGGMVRGGSSCTS